MSLQELVDHIESFEFDSRFSVLSGFSSVLSAMEIDETVQKLVNTIWDDVDSQRFILNRIRSLISDYQEGYMHTHDIAVVVYLFALNECDANGLLELVLGNIANKSEFWWARKLAQKLQTVTTHTQDYNIPYAGFNHVLFSKIEIITKTDSNQELIPT